MARRHDSLVPLSHDHHHTLAQAKRLEEASSSDEESVRRRAVDDFINFYLGRMLQHFREEEELFFAPLIKHERARAGVLRVLEEHLEVHALVRRMKRDLVSGTADPERMKRVGELLPAHVRFEEKEILPLVEELLSEEELKDLASAGRRDV